MLNRVNRFADSLNRNLAVLCLAVAVLALAFPAPIAAMAGSVSVDLSGVPFLGAHFPAMSLVNILLGVIMLGMGMTLKPEDFLLILKRPRDVFTGVAAQYVCMAGFGWLCAQLLQLTGVGDPRLRAEIAVGLVLLGCVPGGTASNVMTFLAKGDVALSVTLTMCTTLLAPLLTPSLTLLLAGQWIQVDFWNMVFSIVLVVLLPILLGLGLHALAGQRVEKYKKVLVLVSTLCIMWVLALCVAPNQSRFTQNGLALVALTTLAVLAHHALGLAAGWLIGVFTGMDEAKVRALSLEVGLQNSGLSCTLANTAFAGTMAILPCAVATVVHQVVGPVVANLFAAGRLPVPARKAAPAPEAQSQTS